jgi:myo-inositol catabolism protein IolC
MYVREPNQFPAPKAIEPQEAHPLLAETAHQDIPLQLTDTPQGELSKAITTFHPTKSKPQTPKHE